MRDFIKENILHILVLIFVSLLLVLCGQIFTQKFHKTACYENLVTIEDRARCAVALGWEVDKTSESLKAVYIPKDNTPEFSEYNEMQKNCGFDLMSYRGKGATLYTYRILNFPSENDVNAFLNIIVYDEKMIGGDVEVLEYDDLYLPVRLSKFNTDIT